MNVFYKSHSTNYPIDTYAFFQHNKKWNICVRHVIKNILKTVFEMTFIRICLLDSVTFKRPTWYWICTWLELYIIDMRNGSPLKFGRNWCDYTEKLFWWIIAFLDDYALKIVVIARRQSSTSRDGSGDQLVYKYDFKAIFSPHSFWPVTRTHDPHKLP